MFCFLTGSKKPKELICLGRADILPILLKLDFFVLLAESLPVFLIACHALEMFGSACRKVNGVTGSSACR